VAASVVVGVVVDVVVDVAVGVDVAVVVGVGVGVVVAVEGRPEMIDINAIKARLARVAGKWPTKGALAPGADDFGPKAWAAHGPLRCHATERGRDRQWTQANADAAFIAAAPADIAALIAEVERLRDEAERERAAVVAWLRGQAEMAYDNTDAHHALWLAAETVERGEHRREETK
jgi:hypothetical protein